MPNLLPDDLSDYVIDEENVLNELNDTPTGYKIGPYFDFSTGDLRMNGVGQIVLADEKENWKQWCEKCILTPRFKCRAYSTDIGVDEDAIINADSREAAEAELTSEISDALMADPYERTAYVSSVEFDWIAPDAVHVTAEIVGIDGTAAVIETDINIG